MNSVDRTTKHTPGPWYPAPDAAEDCGPHRNSGLALIDTGRMHDAPIARLCEWNNVWLIAAAPDLLAACRAAEPVAHISAAGLPVPYAVSSNRLIAHRDGCPGCTLRQSIARAEGGAS